MNKKIIIFTIILFIASSVWLFYQSDRQRDLNSGGEWWAVYFTSPKDDGLNFAVENHSGKTNFHWEILADGSKFMEDDMNVPEGETINVAFEDLNLGDFKDKKISVKVSADGETKKIYKNF